MRTLVDDTYRVEGSFGNDKIAMTLDAAATAHILGVLTGLYSDQELAVLREYSTNALDSHIEAGQTRPIEITLPGTFSHFLTIQDWGVGLGRQDLIDVCSKYGASTKRNTDEQTGSLGLGSKSALAYAQQFTMTAVKNGYCTQIVVARNDEGTADMNIVAEYPTTEPNGVKISVPVRRDNDFGSKAKHFFSFWKPGTVLLNGVDPAIDFATKGTDLGNGIYLVENISFDYVVMGSIAYPLSREHRIDKTADYWSRNGVVVYVPMGSVAFTPNREELIYNRHTLRTLENIRTEFQAGCEKKASEMIDEADTPWAAFRAASKILTIFSNVKGKITWNGRTVPNRVDIDMHRRYSIMNQNLVTHGKSGPYVDSLRFGGKVLFIHNATADAITGRMSDRVQDYAVSNGYDDIFYTRETLKTGPADNHFWLQGTDIVDYATIKSIPVTTARQQATSKGKYRAVINGNYSETTDLDVKDDRGNLIPIIFTESASGEYYSDLRMGNVVVRLGANRVAKFRRDWPRAISVSEYRKQIVDEARKKIDDDMILSYQTYQSSTIRYFMGNSHKIADPNLASAVRRLEAPDAANKRQAVSTFFQTVRDSRWSADFDYYLDNDPSDRYALLRNMHQVDVNHAITYVNAIYKETA